MSVGFEVVSIMVLSILMVNSFQILFELKKLNKKK